MVALQRTALASLCAFVAACVAVPAAASAAAECPEPGTGDWPTATPAEAGMDAAKLQDAINYGQRNSSFAIRVYRNGCRVGEDSGAAANRQTRYQSWSVAKSITALIFGRAMKLGAISPDDPLGSLLPEADEPHGEITMRHLLHATSGLEWNGLRDYNIFMPDRIQNALTTPVAKEPGTYWEYSQDGPALVAEAVERATGRDFQEFAQNELFGPIGIEPGDWHWSRDSTGNTHAFFGMNMTADDYARLGELMRRGGVWGGKRLLSERFVREAVTPSDQNGCYGYLIWVNASFPCVGPRVADRPVENHRDFESLPADVYQYSGLFGQWVTVFPSQELMVVRTGQDSGEAGWQEEMYKRMLGAITDEPVPTPDPSPGVDEVSTEDVDHGFYEAGQHPEQYSQGQDPPPLPPAGPLRARATLIEPRSGTLTKRGRVAVRLRCPPVWPDGLDASCSGGAKLSGAAKRARYDVAAGKKRVLRFEMRDSFLDKLKRKGEADVRARTSNAGEKRVTPSSLEFTLAAR